MIRKAGISNSDLAEFHVALPTTFSEGWIRLWDAVISTSTICQNSYKLSDKTATAAERTTGIFDTNKLAIFCHTVHWILCMSLFT